jgi:hypothetical protein
VWRPVGKSKAVSLHMSLANRSDPGADDWAGDGKSWSKTKSVFEKWWETSE